MDPIPSGTNRDVFRLHCDCIVSLVSVFGFLCISFLRWFFNLGIRQIVILEESEIASFPLPLLTAGDS